MTSGDKRMNGARCKANNRRGERCKALAGSDGLCTAHRDPDRMRELGRAGGKARRAGVAEQLPPAERESLREALRDRLDVETVIQAIERSLEGGNESARVAAVKFLADLELYKAGGEQDWRKDMQQAMVDARAQLEARIRQQAAVLHRRGQSELAQEFTQAATALWKPGERAVTSDGVIVGDYVSSEDAEAVLQGLADLGLIALPSEVERLRAENEQLLAQLAEFTA